MNQREGVGLGALDDASRFALGRSRGGTVYEARDRITDDRVAVKWLRAAEGAVVERLVRAFPSVAGLRHPNVARFFHLEVGDHAAFSMELVEGEDFLSAVGGRAEQRTLDPRRAQGGPPAGVDIGGVRSLLGQILRGLRALHEAGHAHGRLCPRHVRVTEERRAVIVELGTRTESAEPWPYGSPEGASGVGAGRAADLYAVGVMAFEAVAGHRPFDGPGGLYARLRYDAPRLEVLVPEVPSELSDVVAALLHRDPAARHAAVSRLGLASEPPTVRARRPGFRGPFTGTDRFRVVRRLGAGANGRVYEVEDLEDGGRVALKLLHRSDPEARLALKREFRQLVGIRHPGLVALHELHADEDPWFLTMELVEGVGLLEWVGAGAHELVVRRLRTALRSLGAGLDVLHAHGKVHLDIKPANLLVRPSGQVVLVDYGLVSDRGARARGAGTPAYMAPEQLLENELVTPSADWYAVGGIIYRVLASRAPFDGVVADKMAAPPAPLRTVAPHAPEDLCDLADHLLLRDATERPSASSIAATLGFRRAAMPASGAFVGRERELAALRAVAREARGGTARVVRVVGASGQGKSALVGRFLGAFDGCVAAGRCFAREIVAFQGMDEIVEQLVGALGGDLGRSSADLDSARVRALTRLFPTLPDPAGPGAGRVDPDHDRSLAFEAVRRLVQAVARNTRLVLALDDVQWADLDTARMLAGVLRKPTPPVLVVLVHRSGEGGRFLEALPDHVQQAELALEALSPTESQQLAHELLEQRPELGAGHTARIVRESAGSPFFLRLLAAFVLERPSAPAVRLADVVALRVAELAAGPRVLLELVALARRPLPEPVALQAAELLVSTCRAADTWTLVDRRLVRVVDGTLFCLHAQIGEAVERMLTPDQARSGHAALAETLHSQGPRVAEWAAEHWLEAGERQRGLHALSVAADEAASSLAFDRSIRLFTRCLELDSGHPDALRWQEARARCLGDAGRGPESARAYLACAEAASGPHRLRLRSRAFHHLWQCGPLEEALRLGPELFDEAGLSWPAGRARTALAFVALRLQLSLVRLHAVEPCSEPQDTELRQRLDLLESAFVGVSQSLPRLGFVLGLQFCKSALSRGTPQQVTSALVVMGLLYASERREAASRAAFERADAVSAALADPRSLARLQMWHMMREIWEGHFAWVLQRAGPLLARLDVVPGTHFERALARRYDLLSCLATGAIERQIEQTRGYLEDADLRGDLREAAYLRVGCLISAPLLDDDPEAALRDCAWVDAHWLQEPMTNPRLYMLLARALARSYAGDAPGGAAQLERSWPLAVRAGLVDFGRNSAYVHTLRAVVHTAAHAQGSRAGHLEIASRSLAAVERLGDGLSRFFLQTLRPVCVAAERGPRVVERLDEISGRLRAGEAAMFAALVDHASARAAQDADALAVAIERARGLGVRNPDRLARTWCPYPLWSPEDQAANQASRTHRAPR